METAKGELEDSFDKQLQTQLLISAEVGTVVRRGTCRTPRNGEPLTADVESPRTWRPRLTLAHLLLLTTTIAIAVAYYSTHQKLATMR